MKKLFITAVAAITASFTAVSANAAVLNFVGEAERGITNGSTITNFQGTGVNVTFTAGDSDAYFPYFSELSGLGVCKNLAVGVGSEGDDGTGDDCDPSIDGPVSVSESISISGFNNFSMNSITFRDASNNMLGVAGNDGNLLVDTGRGFVQYTFSQVIAKAIAGDFAGINAITFRFVDTQFYVGDIAEIPIPGAIPLMISGLAGLGFVSRRKKA